MKKLLVIDDEKSITDIIATFFEEKGYTVLMQVSPRGEWSSSIPERPNRISVVDEQTRR